jgi:hypothetical protein
MTIYLPARKSDAFDSPMFLSAMDTARKVFGVDTAKLFSDDTCAARNRYDILNAMSTVNTRVAANCNENNQKDLVLLEILKCVKV